MDFTTTMADEPNGLLLIDSGTSEAGDNRNSRRVKCELEAEVFKLSTPISAGISSETPSMSLAFLLKGKHQILDGWEQSRRVTPATLERKSDRVIGEIDILEGHGSLGKATALVDGNNPTDSLPILEVGRLDNGSLFRSDFGFFINRIHFQTQFGGWVFTNKVPVDCLVQNQAKNPHVVDGRVSANLLGSPINIGKAQFARDLGSRFNTSFLKELHELLESTKVAFQGCFLILVRLGKPRGNPLGKFPFASLNRGDSVFSHFFLCADFSGFSRFLHRVYTASCTLLLYGSRLINKFDPPKWGSFPLVDGCHSVASVAPKLKFCNTNRDNQRETNNSCLCRNNSWFESMRGSSSVYQGLASSVAKSVADFILTALLWHPAHV
jgi:hypothetical protein